MTQLEAFAKVLDAVYDAMAAPPRRLCDECLKMREEQEGCFVRSDFGKEWWCHGCQAVNLAGWSSINEIGGKNERHV